MRLKAPQRSEPSRLARALASRLLRLVLFGGCALGLVLLGAHLRGIGWFGEAKLAVERGLETVPNRLGSLFVNPPRITIDCKHKGVQKLAAKREEALEVGHLLTGEEDFVPATIRYTGEAGDLVGPLRAQIRLKGDVIDHLQGPKWSFRVHLRGDSALLGMKRFSLHHPQTRNYLGEWAYQRALAREGILTLRYRFVAVTVNGHDWGIYALEEHFEKRLLEHNQRREGPIVRFNEDMFWREKVQQEVPFPESERNHSGDYSSSEVDGFQTDTLLANPVVREQFVQAADRLERFRAGELKTSEVFDVAKLARYYAVTDLFAAEHGTLWHNARFYYDPVTTRLEPIAFDGDASGPCEGLCATLEGNYIGSEVEAPLELYWARIFSDPVFFVAYIEQLERVADPAYLQALLDGIRPDLDQALAILHKEFVGCELNEAMLWRNQRYIASALDPVRAMHVYARPISGSKVELELAAIQGLPVEVYAVLQGGAPVTNFETPILLPGRLPGVPLTYRKVTVELPDGREPTPEILAQLQVNHAILGRTALRSERVLPWPRTLEPAAAGGAPAASDLSALSFVVVDEERKRIMLRRGHHTLKRDLVLPAGYVVHAVQGTVFDLVESAAIVSRSPIELVGTADEPVVIESSDGTGQGLVVLEAGARSTLSCVVFRGLGAPQRPGWKLTGAVTFYESPVTVDGCRFERARAEDALNVVRAPFRVERSVFSEVASDALDADFCRGSSIVDTEFEKSGNDAIDVSGSQLEVTDVTIRDAGDKGLSAGENSDMVARRVAIFDTEIAVASKDLSRIVLFNPKLVRCKVGFAAFQKKPEFGPAHITAHGIEIQGETVFLIEEGSEMFDGSKPVVTSGRNVEQKLYGVEYGKSSR